MGVETAIQQSFNGGEISPLCARTDLAAYPISVAEMLNIVPTVQGAALKRSGTRFVAPAKTATGAVRLESFSPQLTQTYVLELTDQALRYYTNNAQIAGPYETVTPYLSAELAELQLQESADVIYIVHNSHQQRLLSRTGAATFDLELLELTNGPFKDTNNVDTITLTASGTTGAGITVTATSAIFKPGHVGALFKLQCKDFSDVPAWEPAVSVAMGDKRRSEGKVYGVIGLPTPIAPDTATRTGTSTPLHTEGSAWDGMSEGTTLDPSHSAGGVLWEYLYDQVGIVKITAVAGDGLSCTATVVRRLADSLTSVASPYWAHALFSEEEGWPSSVSIWNERLLLAKDNVLVGSVTGDLANFAERNSAGELTADMAFRYSLAASFKIQWIRPDRQLVVGTNKGIFAVGALNANAAPGPGNLQAPAQSFHGAAPVPPVQIGSKTLFVQRSKRKVREAGYDFSADRYLATDVTVRAEHITRSGVLELAFQQEPYSLVWAVRGDGMLLSLTYAEEQDVRGWSGHAIGGVNVRVESVACITDPAGALDQVWLAVSRTIGGDTVRYIERLEEFWEIGGQATKDAFFVDAGATYQAAPGVTVTSIAGADWLAGETIWVLADGASHPDCVVDGTGSFALTRPASTIQFGLPYVGRITTLPLEAGSGAGTAQSKIKKIIKLAIRLLDAFALRVGPKGGESTEDLFDRSPSTPMGQGPAPFNGDKVVDYPGDFERDAQIVLESFQPFPYTVLALMPRVDTRDGA